MSPAPWIARAFEAVPELAAVVHADQRGLPHAVFSALAALVVDALRGGGAPSVIAPAFALVDAMAEADDDALESLLVRSFFEVLADYEECRVAARAQLGPRAADLLRIATAFWPTRRP